MTVEKLAVVLPVEDLAGEVEKWTALLGVEPTFIDGDRWAQFDVGGSRLALAGSDRVSDEAGLMLKVGDLKDALRSSRDAGLKAGEIETGPHELRALVTGAAAPVVFYTPS